MIAKLNFYRIGNFILERWKQGRGNREEKENLRKEKNGDCVW